MFSLLYVTEHTVARATTFEFILTVLRWKCNGRAFEGIVVAHFEPT